MDSVSVSATTYSMSGDCGVFEGSIRGDENDIAVAICGCGCGSIDGFRLGSICVG